MIMNKKCMMCGKQATHKFVRIEKDQVYDMYFCPEHAVEKSSYQKPKIPLSEILANILSQEQGTTPASQEDLLIECATCGLTFEAYRKSLLLGCSDCYESFRDQLLPELRRFHGSTRHVGRRPGGGDQAPVEMPHKGDAGDTGQPGEAGAPGPKDPASQTEAGSTDSAEQQPIQSATMGASSLIKNPDAAISELSREMNKAISDEDFEKAALCRDQINEIRQQTQGE